MEAATKKRTERKDKETGQQMSLLLPHFVNNCEMYRNELAFKTSH